MVRRVTLAKARTGTLEAEESFFAHIPKTAEWMRSFDDRWLETERIRRSAGDLMMGAVTQLESWLASNGIPTDESAG